MFFRNNETGNICHVSLAGLSGILFSHIMYGLKSPWEPYNWITSALYRSKGKKGHLKSENCWLGFNVILACHNITQLRFVTYKTMYIPGTDAHSPLPSSNYKSVNIPGTNVQPPLPSLTYPAGHSYIQITKVWTYQVLPYSHHCHRQHIQLGIHTFKLQKCEHTRYYRTATTAIVNISRWAFTHSGSTVNYTHFHTRTRGALWNLKKKH